MYRIILFIQLHIFVDSIDSKNMMGKWLPLSNSSKTWFVYVEKLFAEKTMKYCQTSNRSRAVKYSIASFVKCMTDRMELYHRFSTRMETSVKPIIPLHHFHSLKNIYECIVLRKNLDHCHQLVSMHELSI